jgi:hypothetical protein
VLNGPKCIFNKHLHKMKKKVTFWDNFHTSWLFSTSLIFSNICNMGKLTKLGTLELLDFCFTFLQSSKNSSNEVWEIWMRHQKSDEIKMMFFLFQKVACQYLIRRSLGRSSRGATNWLFMCRDQCFFWVKFCQISTSKMWFWSIQRTFNEKNDPNPPNYEGKKFPNC